MLKSSVGAVFASFRFMCGDADPHRHGRLPANAKLDLEELIHYYQHAEIVYSKHGFPLHLIVRFPPLIATPTPTVGSGCSDDDEHEPKAVSHLMEPIVVQISPNGIVRLVGSRNYEDVLATAQYCLSHLYNGLVSSTSTTTGDTPTSLLGVPPANGYRRRLSTEANLIDSLRECLAEGGSEETRHSRGSGVVVPLVEVQPPTLTNMNVSLRADVALLRETELSICARGGSRTTVTAEQRQRLHAAHARHASQLSRHQDVLLPVSGDHVLRWCTEFFSLASPSGKNGGSTKPNSVASSTDESKIAAVAAVLCSGPLVTSTYGEDLPLFTKYVTERLSIFARCASAATVSRTPKGSFIRLTLQWDCAAFYRLKVLAEQQRAAAAEEAAAAAVRQDTQNNVDAAAATCQRKPRVSFGDDQPTVTSAIDPTASRSPKAAQPKLGVKRARPVDTLNDMFQSASSTFFDMASSVFQSQMPLMSQEPSLPPPPSTSTGASLQEALRVGAQEATGANETAAETVAATGNTHSAAFVAAPLQLPTINAKMTLNLHPNGSVHMSVNSAECVEQVYETFVKPVLLAQAYF